MSLSERGTGNIALFNQDKDGNPLAFYVTKIESRSQIIMLLQERGGDVLKRMTPVDPELKIVCIVDDNLSTPITLPQGVIAVTRQYVLDCIDNNALLSFVDYAPDRGTIVMQTVAAAPSSASSSSAYSSSYTASEDKALIEAVAKGAATGYAEEGIRLYQVIAPQFPRHTPQSLRERYLKVLALRRQTRGLNSSPLRQKADDFPVFYMHHPSTSPRGHVAKAAETAPHRPPALRLENNEVAKVIETARDPPKPSLEQLLEIEPLDDNTNTAVDVKEAPETLITFTQPPLDIDISSGDDSDGDNNNKYGNKNTSNNSSSNNSEHQQQKSKREINTREHDSGQSNKENAKAVKYTSGSPEHASKIAEEDEKRIRSTVQWIREKTEQPLEVVLFALFQFNGDVDRAVDCLIDDAAGSVVDWKCEEDVCLLDSSDARQIDKIVEEHGVEAVRARRAFLKGFCLA